MGVFADDHEGTKEEVKKERPAETPPAMPVMDEKSSVMGDMNKGLMFSGDFAGSMTFLDNNAPADRDFGVNLAQFNLKTNVGQSHLNLGFGYGSTVRSLDPIRYAVSVEHSLDDDSTTIRSPRPDLGIHRSTNKLGLLTASYHIKTSYGLGFMLGRFESPVGHETYNHRMNSQFTRSYGFDLAPYFSHGAWT